MTRTTRALVIGTVAVLTSLVTAGGASAEAGDLDARFSGDGATTVTGDIVVDVGVQSTGKVIVLGTRSVGPDASEAVVTRLSANGKVDRSFGTNGTLSYLVNGAAVQPTSLVIQPDDAIVIAGSSGGEDAYQLTVTRLTAVGAIDATFGAGGHRVINRGNNSQATDIELDNANNIVLSGWSNGGTTNTPLIVRLRPNGNRDTTFDGNGVQSLPHPGSALAYGTELAITSNGRYVMAIEVLKGGGAIETSLVRVRPNGLVDTSFGQNGYRRITSPGATRVTPRGLELDSAGRVVVVTYATAELGSTIAQLRVFTPSGAPDANFDGDGRRTVVPVGATFVEDGPYGDLEIQADDRILVGLSVTAEGGFRDSSVQRYREDGRVDRSFSGDGAVIFDPLWEGASYLTALAVSPANNRVYAGGYVVDYMGFESLTPGVTAIRTR